MNESDEFEPVARYMKWCGMAFMVWIVIDCAPSTHAYPSVLGAINTLLAILVLPALLGPFAIMLMAQHRHRAALACLLPALLIVELLNLIPNNPFALMLPYLRTTQVVSLLGLERNAEAERISRRLLKMVEGAIPPNVMTIARARTLRGSALAKLGKFEESEEMTRLAIAGMEGRSGASRSEIAAYMIDLSVTLSRIGKIDASLELGKRALQMLENAPVEAEPATLPEQKKRVHLTKLGMALNNLAVCFDDAGQYVRAQELYKRSLDIKLELFGAQSREAVLGYSNMACALLNQGKYDEALEYAEKAKTTAASINLQSPYLWSEVLSICGDTHRGVGKLDEAKKELEESLRIREKSNNNQLHETWHALGKLYRDKGDFSKAESFFDKTLKFREKRFGAEHPIVGKTLTEYAKLLRIKNNDDAAEQMEKRALAISEQMPKRQ